MIINPSKNRLAKSTGFTLVETMVAIAILLIAVVGPISLIGDSLHKMYYSRDETIAVNLAEEGVEMARQVRDTNMLSGAAWLNSLGNGAASSYTVDPYQFIVGGLPNTFLIYCGAACAPQPVYLDPATGLYRQGSVFTTTQFSRIVTVSSVGLPANEAEVTSTVTWTTGGSTGTITIPEYIYSWAI